MKITAERITCGQLTAGDLFSTAGPDYWNHPDPLAVGEKVYICTGVPGPKGEENLEIYRIIIDKEG